jgi:hypothetical protein
MHSGSLKPKISSIKETLILSILILFENNIVKFYFGTEVKKIIDIRKFFGSFVCLKDSMTMSYKGVLVNNLLYERKYLLSYNILYSKKDNFYL